VFFSPWRTSLVILKPLLIVELLQIRFFIHYGMVGIHRKGELRCGTLRISCYTCSLLAEKLGW